MKEKNNEYYTPSLEEFQWGLEYEIYWAKAQEWKKFNVCKWFSFETLEEDLKKEQYRVKYLDKDDLEDLDFKEERNELFFGKTIGDIDILIELPSEHGIHHRYKIFISPSKNREIPFSFQSPTLKYDGVILNKSELIKILGRLILTKNETTN